MSGGPKPRGIVCSFLSTPHKARKVSLICFRCSLLDGRVSGGLQSCVSHGVLLNKADVALIIYTASAPSEVCAVGSGCHRAKGTGQPVLGQK